MTLTWKEDSKNPGHFIARAGDLLQLRVANPHGDWLATVIASGEAGPMLGPFPSQADAQQAAEDAARGRLECALFDLRSAN